MKILWAFFTLTVLQINLSSEQVKTQNWDEFKSNYNRTFQMEFREDRRRKAFEENLVLIEQHNEEFHKGHYSFKLSPNSLADLSNTQYMKRYVRLLQRFDPVKDGDYILGDVQYGGQIYPDTLDWRAKGFVTPPSNQKSCGSCYAFSIAHSLEGQIFKKINKLVQLSTQQLVDCSGNHGCSGGSLRTTLKYLESSSGLMREKEYPYNALQNKCGYNPDLAVVNVTSWAILPSKNEEIMKTILNEVGPIAVSINAALKTFQLYSEGIYDDKECDHNVVNHAMLLVGYTEDAWILKNWWGERWGEKGYMRVKRGVNMCGISNYAAYAIA